MIEIEIPGPQVSINRGYRGGRGRFYMTREASEFKDRILAFAKLGMRGKLKLAGELEVHIDFHYANPLSDIDGPVKFLLDGLEGIVFDNDRQVRLLTISKNIDRKNPRTRVTCATRA